jgi:molybdenum cofactor biosynthesis enzyme MoaA
VDKALEKLPPTSFYFSAGEPFLYKDLPYIINNLPEKHSIIGIVTNASMPLSIYRKIKKKIHLNVSFHREFTSEKEFISKVTELQNFFHLTVNIVATPVNLDFLKTLDKICKSNKIALHVDPFIDFAAEKPQFSKEQLQILKNC